MYGLVCSYYVIAFRRIFSGYYIIYCGIKHVAKIGKTFEQTFGQF